MTQNAKRPWVIAGVVAALGVAAGCRGGAPPPPPAANTPPAAENTPAPASTTGRPPANLPAGAVTAGAAGASVAGENPFPGKPAGRQSSRIVRITAARNPDHIPGVPRLPLPGAAHSPFRPQGTAGASAPAAAVTRKAPVLPAPPAGGMPMGGGKAPDAGGFFAPIPPLSVPWPPDTGGANPAPVTRKIVPALAATPLAPAMQLTGVIRGKPLMAIIEGEKNHYIVQEGDAVAGGYRVAVISLQKVVLRTEGRQTLVLRLGGKRT